MNQSGKWMDIPESWPCIVQYAGVFFLECASKLTPRLYGWMGIGCSDWAGMKKDKSRN